jgi:hypothetical protein
VAFHVLQDLQTLLLNRGAKNEERNKTPIAEKRKENPDEKMKERKIEREKATKPKAKRDDNPSYWNFLIATFVFK